MSLRCNFVDGTSGTTYLRLVGSEGSMDVKWEEVVLRTNEKNEPQDDFLLGKVKETSSQYGKRKRMLSPRETIFKTEEGYKGAHYDHFVNFFRGIREEIPVAENAEFGFRAAAPALACNNSYFENKIINWNPVKMKLG